MEQTSERTDVRDFETPPRGILTKAFVAVFGAVVPTFLLWGVVLAVAVADGFINDRVSLVVLDTSAVLGIAIVLWLPILILFRARTTDVVVGLLRDLLVESPLRWIRNSEGMKRHVAVVSYGVLLIAVISSVLYLVTAVVDVRKGEVYESVEAALAGRIALVEAIDDVSEEHWQSFARPAASAEEKMNRLVTAMREHGKQREAISLWSIVEHAKEALASGDTSEVAGFHKRLARMRAEEEAELKRYIMRAESFGEDWLVNEQRKKLIKQARLLVQDSEVAGPLYGGPSHAQ